MCTSKLCEVETKRYLYEPLLKTLNDNDVLLQRLRSTKSGCLASSCYAILGVRGIGKTILLQQLYDACPEHSAYLDFSLSCPDIETWFEAQKSSGKTRLFLDEVCKVPEDMVGKLVHEMHESSKWCSVVFTGSVRKAVADISSSVCRGIDIELPPIMYVECLAWRLGCSLSDFSTLFAGSSIPLFTKYMYEGSLTVPVGAVSTLDYVRGIIKDTLASYNGYDSVLESLTEQDIKDILAYVSLCQHVYMREDNKFCQAPSISVNLPDVAKALRKRLKATVKDDIAKIRTVCRVLTSSGLAKATAVYTDEENSYAAELRRHGLTYVHLIDKDIPSMLFLYPWYASYAFSSEILGDDILRGIWFESLVLTKLSFCYDFVDKYRSIDDRELDNLYAVSNFTGKVFGAVECKWQERSHTGQSVFKKYGNIANRVGASELIVTNRSVNGWDYGKDAGLSPAVLYRCDMLIMGIECEFISLSEKQFLGQGFSSTSLTVVEIMQKFGFDKRIEEEN